MDKAIRFDVGRTMVEGRYDHEEGQRRFKRVFHILAYVEGEEHDPYVHDHAFGYEPDAEDLLAKVEEAGLDVAHLEASDHWEQEGKPAPEDRLTLEEKWAIEAHRERQRLY